MKKTLLSFTAIGSMVAALFLLALPPALAGDVDERITALEQELAQLKGEQMELKKEATAARGARPDFRYRPRSGLRIRAKDRSWEITFAHVFHGRLAFFPDQQDAADRADGQYFGRRNRPYVIYRWNKGFYGITWRVDSDGDRDDGELRIQRGQFNVRFDRISPWLPRFQIGMDNGATLNWHDSNWSSSSSGHLERSMLVRNIGVNTGGSHTGFGFIWRRIPLKPVTPGIGHVEFHVLSGIGEGDGVSTDSDRKDFYLFGGVKPFSRSKNKWIKGIDFGVGFAFGNIDTRADDSSTRRLRIRDHRQVAGSASGNNNRITLFDFDNMGDGYFQYITPGFGWRIGPYRLRVAGGAARWEDRGDKSTSQQDAGKKGAYFWNIAHELFVWSPKGFFTGNSNGPNSVMLSWMFEADHAFCKGTGEDSATCSDAGSFSRNRVVLRELDLWLFLKRNVSIGIAWLWYDAANVAFADQVAIGCTKNTGNQDDGKSCDWHNVVLALRAAF